MTKTILRISGYALETNQTLDKFCQLIRAYDPKSIIVVSATRALTDLIIELSKNYDKEKVSALQSDMPEVDLSELEEALSKSDGSKEATDHAMWLGEKLTTAALAKELEKRNISVEICDSLELLCTDGSFGNAKVQLDETNRKIKSKLSNPSALTLVSGFSGSNDKGQITTIGRGGADYVASLIAEALGAKSLVKYSRHPGILTANPLLVSKAKTIKHLEYEEALELVNAGERAIFPSALLPAMRHKIAVNIRPLLDLDCEGTTISAEDVPDPSKLKGISCLKNQSIIQVSGTNFLGSAGVASKVFDVFTKQNVSISFISQAASEHSICVSVSESAREDVVNALAENFSSEIKRGEIAIGSNTEDMSVISVVGARMQSEPGIASKIFGALSRNGINVIAIAQGASESNISIAVNSNNLSKAANAIHDDLFLSQDKTINLFVAGLGQVGKGLLSQFQEHQESLRTGHKIDLALKGLARSNASLIDEAGLELDSWEQAFNNDSKPDTIEDFTQKAIDLNLPNCVFVDCSASEEVAEVYTSLLDADISIVTPNKKAASGNFSKYQNLFAHAADSNGKFYYETNVGAGLPVISTLKDLLLSGDKIIEIEAILSGTLSYIFNTIQAESKFSEVVRGAMEQGYTEPDPRDDLDGSDVARKILILAREIGAELNLEDIKVDSLVPPGGAEAASVDDFFKILANNDDAFLARTKKCMDAGNKLRFISSLKNGECNVGLTEVGPDHPFFSMSGTDNIICFRTERYNSCPLVIKGPGAGVEVTAAGVFADIIRAASYF